MSVPLDAEADAQRRIVRVGRILAMVAAVWTCAYLVLFLVLTLRFSAPIPWLYLVNLLVGIGLIGWSLTAEFGRMLLQIAVVVLAVAAIFALPSTGILLAPAVVIAAFAARRVYHP